MTDHDQYFRYLLKRSKLGHLYRTYWLYPRLVRRLRGKTLDIGCGIGDMLAFRPQTTGVDVNEHTLRFCRERGLEAHLMVPDVLPFADMSFDSVLLDNVLEHIEVPAPLLAEVRRVLVPGGRFLVGVPGQRGWQSDPDHKVMYDEGSLRTTVERAGFRSVEVLHTPIGKSSLLDRKLRQYCLYGLFEVSR
ncbi:class I SAM-dependent methyltransferase [Piscinibacter gummiphilus]|uniref:Uncharacterized protein n=1 Tax=Piscinibacter gummiphilus TaxID=946333 RepID=A0A1W6LEG9_9BURK|nr:class I SAM-dependent methyltransferase [Piscinibacter gummiphilus]ARN22640.1 hypothetical protein A4W93_23515 [Piscinibacter gummiphilus]GLS97683.1 hypothetical protein GCM10007918_49750 [Piscinibacter gummiphilus]